MQIAELLTSEQLHPVKTDRVGGGAEKDVYKVVDGIGHVLAAKLYRTIYEDSHEPVDRATASVNEFNAYKAFRTTALLPYIPCPVRLLHENSEPVGLLVEWKNFTLVRDYNNFAYIPNRHFNGLEQVILSLPDNLAPNEDCVEEKNLAYNKQGLWFTECAIWHRDIPREAYNNRVRKQFDYLRKNYGTNR